MGDMTTAQLAALQAWLLDLDGVITPTAALHRRAWKSLFTAEFRERGVAPYEDSDYFDYLDGKPRRDGVRDMLAARGLQLPEGMPADGPDAQTVYGLGKRKNERFLELLRAEGIAPFVGSLRFLDELARRGVPAAVVTSSRNGREVLAAAGLGDRFDVVVDGVVAAELGLEGKPDPDSYLEAARELGVSASVCAVVEDALSGVAAGAAGGFGAVIGVDRGAGKDALAASGASLVVSDLAELLPLLAGGAGPERGAASAGQDAPTGADT